MNNIMNAAIVLKLNKSWQPVGFADVHKSIVDLCADINCFALDIEYDVVNGKPDFDRPTFIRPVDWDTWITLPVRSWDLVIHSPHLAVRVPTVLIARNFNRMPMRYFKGRPSRNQIWHRDQGIDQYSGQPLNEDDASLDHVIPASRGGKSTWENLVLTHEHTNSKKGNKMNEEAGLRLIREPKAPKPQPVAALITIPKHHDWKHFLIYK